MLALHALRHPEEAPGATGAPDLRVVKAKPGYVFAA
jgi:hypothetical protein